MQRSCLQLGLCLLLLLCNCLQAAEPPHLAVISTDQSGWSDLLMTRLSKDPAVSLVERDDLAKALDEVELTELLGDRKKRSRFGKIVGADFLAILSMTENRARLVVCDTHLGVTLQDQSISIAEQPQEKVLGVLANTALQTIQSFAGGVKQIVAVPNFLCRDLTFDFTYLQSDYAELLQSAYRQIPGVAIVAIEEAKAIAIERDMAGLSQKDRIVSVFIEGEYRTTRDLQSGGVSVEITLRARDSSKLLLDRKLPPTPTSQAGKELMTFFTKDLAALTQTGETKIDEQSQYRMLIERADEFALIGDFLRSTELREAALLLNPDDDAQRLKLIREYVRTNYNLCYESNGWPIKTKPTDIYPKWLAISDRAISDWKRSLQHCEYLVLNHRLSPRQAADVCNRTIRSLLGSRVISSERLKECEEIKRNFVRHVFSRIPHWDPVPREVEEKNLDGERIYFRPMEVYEYIFITACSGREAKDLDLISDLLIHLLPDSLPRSPHLIGYLRTISILFDHVDSPNGFTLAEFQAFLERLLASDRPLVRVYGRYGKFCLRRAKGENLPTLLKEMQGILNEAEALGYEVDIYDGFITVFRGEVRCMNEAILREIAHTTPAPPRSPPRSPPSSVNSAPQPKSRVSLEHIDLRLVNTKDKGKLLTSDTEWHSSKGWGGVGRYRPLTTGLDAMWSDGFGEVFFIPRPGELVQVLADKKLKVSDVVCDGRYVWVGSADDWGLSVLDLNGREITRMGNKEGLPPGSNGIIVHPIEPGRVLVAGSFGKECRGWIATVQFDGRNSKVKVIHEATKSRMNSVESDRADPAMAFMPTAMIEHAIPGAKPRRIVFIPRIWQPLTVDLESLKVQVYPGDASNNKWFPRFSAPKPDHAFLSHQGILWVAPVYGGFSSYRLNDETGLLEPIRVHPDSNVANMSPGGLARDGEWLYYAGQEKWQRLNLRTGEEEILLQYTNHLPHYGTSRKWHLYYSTHYGLVAFNEGCLYRVKIPPDETTQRESIMNPSQVATYTFLGSSLCLVFIANHYRRRKRADLPVTPDIT